MTDTIDPGQRAAALPTERHPGGVTLINRFVVDANRDAAFTALWEQTSQYFRSQPGFIALRLHRAVSPGASHRYVNVADWTSTALFQAAHQTDEFRRLVGQPAWQEFPSSPALYQVATTFAADPALVG